MKLKKKMNRLKTMRFIFGIISLLGFVAMLGIVGGIDVGSLDFAHSAFAIGGSMFALISGVLVMKHCDDELYYAQTLLVSARREQNRRSRSESNIEYYEPSRSSIA